MSTTIVLTKLILSENRQGARPDDSSIGTGEAGRGEADGFAYHLSRSHVSSPCLAALKLPFELQGGNRFRRTECPRSQAVNEIPFHASSLNFFQEDTALKGGSYGPEQGQCAGPDTALPFAQD